MLLALNLTPVFLPLSKWYYFFQIRPNPRRMREFFFSVAVSLPVENAVLISISGERGVSLPETNVVEVLICISVFYILLFWSISFGKCAPTFVEGVNKSFIQCFFQRNCCCFPLHFRFCCKKLISRFFGDTFIHVLTAAIDQKKEAKLFQNECCHG